MLYEELDRVKIFDKDPRALIYKDMEEIEAICNSVINNGEVAVVHQPAFNQPPRVVKSVNVVYDTNKLGFAVPNTVRFLINF